MKPPKTVTLQAAQIKYTFMLAAVVTERILVPLIAQPSYWLNTLTYNFYQ